MNTANLITLAEVRDVVKRWVDNGTCNTSRIDAVISEAEQRLWAKADWRLSRKRVRVRCQNQTFPLPLEVEKILKVDLDGSPAHVFDPAYEFMDSGPGDLDLRSLNSGYKDLVDLGEFPTQFEIPIVLTQEDDEDCTEGTVNDGFKLFAFSPYVEDCEKYVTIRGLSKTSDEIFSDQSGSFLPGEKIPINRWTAGVEGQMTGVLADYQSTTNLFSQVTRVYKEATKGPVSLFAFDSDTNYIYLLSKMIPSATVPSYRRYRITNRLVDEYGHDVTHILAWVKLRHMPAVNATDIVAIQNMAALKNMVIAIKFENENNLAQAQAYEVNAFRLLADQKLDEDSVGGTMSILDYDSQLVGRRLNRGYYF